MPMLITSLNFGGCEIKLRIEKFREITRESFTIEFLITTMCELFSCNLNGYLCRSRECWALFKRGKAFYLFDPLGVEVKEKKIARRRAVLYKFESIELMAEQIMNIAEEIFEEKCEDNFEVGAIFICPSTTPGREEPKKSNNQRASNQHGDDSGSDSDSAEYSTTTEDSSTN
jgi:hypothetical protein